MTRIITFDYETTTFQKGNPYSRRNKAVVASFKEYKDNKQHIVWFDDGNDLNTYLKGDELLVGFNAKFDLAWLRRSGVDTKSFKVFDCQLAEFLLTNQTNPYPSLNETSEKYGLGSKIDVIATEYWDKGIDTPDIPRDILQEYLEQDINLTEKVFEVQIKLLREQGKYNLFRLMCEDLVILHEMEWNGMMFDADLAKEKAKECEEQLKELRKDIIGHLSFADYFNLNSGEHVSALLYGGVIKVEDKVPNGFWKSGAREGMVRYKTVEYKFDMPRIFEPIEGTELKKEGYWQTDEPTLRKLKGSKKDKEVIEKLLKYAELDKLKGTYYEGLSSLIEEMDWPKNEIHGQFNQCVTATGRLSSSKPNAQNYSGDMKVLFYTRY